MYPFTHFTQHRIDIYKASMPTMPSKPATLAPTMAVGMVAAPVEEDGTAEALAEVVVTDVPVLPELPEDPVAEVEVELLYFPVTEAVVFPEEPVVRTTNAELVPVLQLNQPIV